MSLSITHSASGMLRTLSQTQGRLERTLAHLATGKRIATASDDAAGLAIATRLGAAVTGLAQGERNLAGGIGYTSTAEGSLQSSHDSLLRMRELSVQAQNGTLNGADRATIQQEYDQLAATLDQASQGNRTVTFTDGNGGEIAVDVADTSAAALGVGGLGAAHTSTLAAIDRAVDQVSGQRGRLGAAENQLGRRAELVATMREGLAAAQSRIADADFGKEIADLSRDRMLQNLQLVGLAHTARASRAAMALMA